jgi:hypothetical protein
MEHEYLPEWPEFWPPPDVFFGPLAANIAGVHSRAQLPDRQVIVRFKNRYGVKISQSRLYEGLYVVNALKLPGTKLDDYQGADDADVSNLTWCFTSEEVFAFCQEVARWHPI